MGRGLMGGGLMGRVSPDRVPLVRDGAGDLGNAAVPAPVTSFRMPGRTINGQGGERTYPAGQS